jgi:hypothetical protein
MRIIIRYARIDKAGELKPFEDFRYEAEFSLNGDKKEDKRELKKVLTAVMRNYGDCYLDHYPEKKADVFACYYEDDSKPFFVSDMDKKADPLAVIDGFIARFRVKKVILTNGNITHTLSSPKHKTSKSANHKNTIKVSKLITVYKSSNDTLSGKNIIICFPYRDGSYSDVPNMPCADNTIPFIYILKGEMTSSKAYYDYDDCFCTDDYTINYDFRIRERLEYGKKIICILVGKVMIKHHETGHGVNDDIKTSAEGLFYSDLKACDIKELDDYLKLSNIIPWKIAIKTDFDIDIPEIDNVRTIDTKLEFMIRNQKYIEIDSRKAVLKIMKDNINHELNKYGLSMYDDSNNLVVIDEKQADELLMVFVNKYGDSKVYYRINILDLPIIIKKCKVNIGKYIASRKSEEDFSKLISSISKSVSDMEKKYQDNTVSNKSKLKTTYHELGHAFAANLLAGKGGIWEEITVISNPDKGYGGCCSPTKEADELLPNLTNQIMVSLAGRAAEKIFIGAENAGWGQDYLDSKMYVVKMLMKDSTGFTYDKKTKKIYAQVDGFEPMDADSILDELVESQFDKTVELLKPEKKYIKSMAPILIEKGTISGKLFDEIFENRNR